MLFHPRDLVGPVSRGVEHQGLGDRAGIVDLGQQPHAQVVTGTPELQVYLPEVFILYL